MTRAAPSPEELDWALGGPRQEALAVAPGWFRAWPTADEKWSVVNVRSKRHAMLVAHAVLPVAYA